MYQLYVNVDSEGNIIEGITGETIIPDKAYTFFFMLEELVDELELYKVTINGLTPKLVKK